MDSLGSSLCSGAQTRIGTLQTSSLCRISVHYILRLVQLATAQARCRQNIIHGAFANLIKIARSMVGSCMCLHTSGASRKVQKTGSRNFEQNPFCRQLSKMTQEQRATMPPATNKITKGTEPTKQPPGRPTHHRSSRPSQTNHQKIMCTSPFEAALANASVLLPCNGLTDSVVGFVAHRTLHANSIANRRFRV